jgi:2-ketocyclohexanecarboxyl-CoA hydrolase
MTSDDVLYRVDGDIAWVTLNRPERKNAMDGDMFAHFAELIDQAGREAGVVVIIGAGDTFCAGGFLGALAEPSDATVKRLFDQTFTALSAVRRCPRPVIAAIDGFAVGGGNELVVACDLAIATDRAILGQTGPRVGSAPVLGGTNLLAMSIGEKRAKEVAFMCRRYSATEALNLGWVNAVVPAQDLVTEATRWADELLVMSPRYLEIAKASSNVWWNTCAESMSSGVAALTQAIGSEDMIEGASAFLERRPPQFRRRWGDDA